MLPTQDQAWPPRELKPVFLQAAVHDAWWEGDANRLAAVYSGTTDGQKRNLRGKVASFFWGKDQPARESRTRIHVPVASDISEAASRLLFGNAPTWAADDQRTQDRLDLIIGSEHATGILLGAAEMQSALGGVYLRALVDKTAFDHATFTSHDVDQAVPEWRHGQLIAVTFWTVTRREGQHVYRHLERHEPGVILHGLYRGTATNLGIRVRLIEDPATEHLALEVGEQGQIPTGIDSLTAVYVPNKTPNRRFRTTPGLAEHGRSDFYAAEGIFDAIDETYSSWMRDVRVGKARIIVPQMYLEGSRPGDGVTFDEDREIFQGLEMLATGTESSPFTVAQFKIRVQEHQETIRELTRAALRAAGLSPATFGDDAVPVNTTATEIKARKETSEGTREIKLGHWRPRLTEFARALLDLDRVHYGGAAPAGEVDVLFAREAQADPEALARTASLLSTAQAASTETLVRTVNPGWDDEQVMAEVGLIRGEQGRDVTDPTGWPI